LFAAAAPSSHAVGHFLEAATDEMFRVLGLPDVRRPVPSDTPADAVELGGPGTVPVGGSHRRRFYRESPTFQGNDRTAGNCSTFHIDWDWPAAEKSGLRVLPCSRKEFAEAKAHLSGPTNAARAIFRGDGTGSRADEQPSSPIRKLRENRQVFFFFVVACGKTALSLPGLLAKVKFRSNHWTRLARSPSRAASEFSAYRGTRWLLKPQHAGWWPISQSGENPPTRWRPVPRQRPRRDRATVLAICKHHRLPESPREMAERGAFYTRAGPQRIGGWRPTKERFFWGCRSAAKLPTWSRFPGALRRPAAKPNTPTRSKTRGFFASWKPGPEFLGVALRVIFSPEIRPFPRWPRWPIFFRPRLRPVLFPPFSWVVHVRLSGGAGKAR